MRSLFVHACISGILLTGALQNLPAAEEKILVKLPPPDASEAQEQFHSALAKVRNHAVALNVSGGEASGAILTADGLVMTAAHVVMNAKPEDKATIELEDGRKFKAHQLGHDLEIDFALLQIEDVPAEGLPHCEMATKTPSVGSYCFVLGHPSGKAKNRPALPRLGRILNIPQRDGKPWIGMMDCEIQPGDSGCPVFDLKGRLIGVGSSAAGHRRFNRFGIIDQLRANMEFLKTPGNKRGTFDKGPGGKAGYDHKFVDQDVEKLQALLQTRLKDQHQQTSLFVKKHMTGENNASINSNDLVNFFYLDGLAVADGRDYSYGLDDPELLKPLLGAVKSSGARLAMQVGGSPAGFALRTGKTQLVTADEKLGETNGKPVTLKLPDDSTIEATVAKRDATTGLAMLEIPADTKSPILDLTKSKDHLATGDLLVAVDADGVIGLGNAMDEARPIGAPDSEGPVGDNMPLNQRRGNFPMVVTHSLPLYATDTVTPVYTLDGSFAGLHLARATRTYGVLIRPKELREFLEHK